MMLIWVVDEVGPNNHVHWVLIPRWEGAIFAEMPRIGRMCTGDMALPELLWYFLYVGTDAGLGLAVDRRRVSSAVYHL